MLKQKPQHPISPEKYIRTRARSLPLGPCYINKNWQELGFATIVVTRMHSNRNITHGMFIVDMLCLGIKDAFWMFNEKPQDFKAFMDKQIIAFDTGFPMIKISYTLGHNIIYGAIAFAEEIGFHPYKNFELTKYILEEDDESVDLIDLKFGHKGKPLYVSSSVNPDEARRVKAHLEQRLGSGNFNFIKEEDLDAFFEGEDQSDEPANGNKPVADDVDYFDPDLKMQIIKKFIAYEKIKFKPTEDQVELANQIPKYADTIYYKYILSAEDINQAIDTISTIFDFEMTNESLSDEMLFGNTPSAFNPEEIRVEATKLHRRAAEKNLKKMQKEVEAAMIKYPGIPIFQYYHLQLLRVNESKKTFHQQVMAYMTQNPTYYPFGIMTAIDFLINNPEKIHRSVTEDINLRNFFPGRTAFCEEEVLLFIQVLTQNYLINGQYAILEQMYSYLEDTYPGLFTKEKLHFMKALKVPYLIEWCKEWMKKNS